MEGSGLPHSTYLNMRRFFRHKLKLNTEYLMYRRIKILSGVKPKFYDTCPRSCCLFVGRFEAHTICPYCDAPRCHPNGKPVARFSYLPIIPRVQAWFKSLSMITRLKYRSGFHHTPGHYSDVFDGSNYQTLL